MKRTRMCAFCGIELDDVFRVGRPSTFCSTRCRQADHDERAGRVMKLSTWHRWRRRHRRRFDVEYQRIRSESGGGFGGVGPGEASQTARARASRAWRQPRDSEEWSDYVVDHEGSQGRA